MGSTVFIQKESADHVRLTNKTGADLVQYEFTVIGGIPCIADEAIANNATGSFHVSDVVFEAADFNVGGDTFATLGADVYFDPSAKKFSDIASAAFYKVGIVKEIKSSNGVVVVLKDNYATLNGSSGNAVQLSYNVTADATAGLAIAVPYPMEILDVIVQCRAANVGGTLQLKNGATAINDAQICAVDKVITRAGTIDDAQSSLTPATVLKVFSNGAADRGLITIIGRRV
jgi:hypothetical protein